MSPLRTTASGPGLTPRGRRRGRRPHVGDQRRAAGELVEAVEVEVEVEVDPAAAGLTTIVFTTMEAIPTPPSCSPPPRPPARD
jgi:hypothetical protein